MARLREVCCGGVSFGRQGKFGRGKFRHGELRRSVAWQAWQVESWCVKERWVKLRLGRQVPARQVVLCYGGLLRVTVRQVRFGSVG